jgi:Ser/Thr protein kinase RdoA (MazF antagonist)
MGTDHDFAAWLSARHEAMVTPPDVIAAQVRRATGQRVNGLERVIIGQDNEVYEVATADGPPLIVRISHGDDPRFVAERWALEAARAAGAPTPLVYLAEDRVPAGATTLGFSIQERLPGLPMDRLPAGAAVDALAGQVGRALGAMHSVPVDGFGYLRPGGRAWDITFADIMLDLVDRRAEVVRAAHRWGAPDSAAAAGLDLLLRHRDGYRYDRPVLVHGDFGPPHVFVDGDRITGIIDLQGAAGCHPVFDFVHWYTHWDSLVPVSRLMAAYPDRALFDGGYPTLLRMCLLRQALWMLVTADERDNPHLVPVALRDLDMALRSALPRDLVRPMSP